MKFIGLHIICCCTLCVLDDFFLNLVNGYFLVSISRFNNSNMGNNFRFIGLDVLADAKRESKDSGAFKVPKEKRFSSLSSIDVEERCDWSDTVENDIPSSSLDHSHRHYRGSHSEEVSHTGG